MSEAVTVVAAARLSAVERAPPSPPELARATETSALLTAWVYIYIIVWEKGGGERERGERGRERQTHREKKEQELKKECVV